jgi:hypothetical protein
VVRAALAAFSVTLALFVIRAYFAQPLRQHLRGAADLHANLLQVAAMRRWSRSARLALLLAAALLLCCWSSWLRSLSCGINRAVLVCALRTEVEHGTQWFVAETR